MRLLKHPGFTFVLGYLVLVFFPQLNVRTMFARKA